MALIICKDCGSQVSDTSSVCPCCGAPLKYVTCSDCGESIPADLDTCPNCGAPQRISTQKRQNNSALTNNISPDLEKSNDFDAEHVVNSVASLSLLIGAIIGVVGLIAGIALIVSPGYGNEMLGGLCIGLGILIFLICLLAWATLRLFVNMSYRLTRIDNKFQSA